MGALRPVSRRLVGVLALAACAFLGNVAVRGMPDAPAGALEVGAPSFDVLGLEALGLSTPPTDLHLLPDGRILVVAQDELAFADSARWETFRGPEEQLPLLNQVAVDGDGKIYAGTREGIARIELGEGARWHVTTVVKLPPEVLAQNSILSLVAAFPDHWYWYGGNGAIVSWRPGQTARVVGSSGSIERIFALAKDVYFSDQSSGALARIRADGTSERVQSSDPLVSDTVTCAIPFDSERLLVGTAAAGPKLFDGKTFRPFGPGNLLREGKRITDLCAVGEDVFAASVDSVGVVFFDRAGQTLQVLDRSLDHRLGRVQRLQYSQEGVLWGLLNDGVARIEFPSAISNFDPLLASGLTFAQPLRHLGQLWILTDGRAMQGVYDPSGRLVRFQDETPPGHYLFTLLDVDGQLFASNDEGIYVFEAAGWVMVLPGIVNARIGVATSLGGDIFYVARGEYGVIRRTGEKYSNQRTLLPGLTDTFSSIIDSAGIGWLEMGASRVGRFDPHGGEPVLRLFGTRDGLLDGWVEEFLIDGIARFRMEDSFYRFDDTKQKFVDDPELLKKIPQLADAYGRPASDGLGRLWFTEKGKVHVIERGASGDYFPVKVPQVGFAASIYTAQDDGVVWLFARRRLARMDLRTPQSLDATPRALITSVQFPASHRQLFAIGDTIAPVSYSDNSLVIHFAAPSNPFSLPVTFEVLMEGAGTQWVSTGAVGSATYDRLKEGDYVFHVRPVVGGTLRGTQDQMKFTVQAPWFRTTLAWVTYVAAGVGLIALMTWLSSYLQGRKNRRLERLVAMRTGELKSTNAQLGRQIEETTEKSEALSVSEDRYRVLNAELEDRVNRRTAELSLSNVELRQRELLFRLIFEHAPVGISWKRTDLGDYYHFNPTVRHILDLSSTAVTDYPQITNLVHPEDAPRQAEMNRLLVAGETDSYILEERFVLKDGRLVWGRLSVAVIRDESAHIIQEIGILEDITTRKRSEEELAFIHKNLLEASRKAGMAEVATGVLHNVGNVLNSVNVSATLIADNIRHSKTASIVKLAALVNQNKSNLAEFLTLDARGRMIPGYLDTLVESLAVEKITLNTELDHLRKNIEHIKDIVAMQQSYARTSGVIETISVPDMIEDALRINSGSLARHNVDTFRDYQSRPVITTDKHKVMQILINLVRNSKYACDESGRADKQITVRTTSDSGRVKIAVIDNGIGIPEANLTRIFNHGFTTRKDGHGFGLHSGALAAKELGGSLHVQSGGAGQGATFTLELPYKLDTPANANSDS